jgi:hypothetical protein
MQVLKLQCQARFDFPGKDAASIAGIIPNLAPLFEAGGKSLLLDIGGNTVVFTLDEKGRGKNTQGSVMLKLKPAKRNKTTKKLEFQGGPVAFSAKVRNVDWADEWLDDGFEPGADAKKVPQDMAVELWLDGKVYTATVTGSYTAKAEKGGRLKK